MLPDRKRAEEELAWAGEQNPGIWVDHSNYVAMACEHIASRCGWLDNEHAYVVGLLHDVGRFPGRISERHLIEGYRRCMEHGWDEAAKICISHAFMIQDIGTSIGIFDMPEGTGGSWNSSSGQLCMMIMTVWCSCVIPWPCPADSAFWKSGLWM